MSKKNEKGFVYSDGLEKYIEDFFSGKLDKQDEKERRTQKKSAKAVCLDIVLNRNNFPPKSVLCAKPPQGTPNIFQERIF